MVPQRKRLLIPTDGSEKTGPAIAFALEMAKITRASVTALSVNDVSTYAPTGKYAAPDAVSSLYQECMNAVNRVVDEGRKMGVDVEPLVTNGNPTKAIVDASREYDLIVMGTAARTGVSLLLLGSVAQKVIRFSSCPVLVVGSAHPGELKCRRILIPTDGNDNTWPAVRYGLEVARAFNAEVTALSVSSTKSSPFPPGGGVEHFPPGVCRKAVEYVANEGRRFGVVVTPAIVPGSPANEILRASSDHDLIVMGTNGRTGLDYLRLGSVAEKTIRHARCPVLVVRSDETLFYKGLLES
ncbi:universal stress protein [Methanoculleus sp.]|uniref:universal stress protein n=1 Tax=Methanoculleus sp. TaxID=90427 RepID=UPI002FC828EB